MEKTYYPTKSSPVVDAIPDNLPDYTAPVYTPKDDRPEGFYDRPPMQRSTGPIPQFKQDMAEAIEYYDDPDYTEEVSKGINDILNERPQLTRSEAEEQMHLTELRRLAEAYTANDARVISEVLAKKYAPIMFIALNDEYKNMKNVVDTVTGAVQNADLT